MVEEVFGADIGPGSGKAGKAQIRTFCALTCLGFSVCGVRFLLDL
jgi:hypothetical protein